MKWTKWFFFLLLISLPQLAWADSDEGDEVETGITLMVFGALAFFHGFRELRLKRLIENTPTSTTRALAMGHHVEVVGRGMGLKRFISPISGRETLYCQWKIQKERQSKNSTHWSTVKTITWDQAFLLFDQYGCVQINPKKARLYSSISQTAHPPFASAIQGELISHGVKLGWGKHRILETVLMHEDELYALGYAEPVASHNNALEYWIDQTLREEQQKMLDKPGHHSPHDANHDGVLSPQEVSQAQEKLRAQWLQTADQKIHAQIAAGGFAKLLVLSDKSEKELVAQMSKTSVLSIFGGPVLFAVGLAIILWKVGG